MSNYTELLDPLITQFPLSNTTPLPNSVDFNHVPIQMISNPIPSLHETTSSQNNLTNSNSIPEDGNHVPRNLSHPCKKKNITCDEKKAIFTMLLKESQNGNLPYGTPKRIAKFFSISSKSVTRIWNEGRSLITADGIFPDFSSKLVQRAGRKKITISLQQMKNVPLRRRTNIWSLSNALNISKSTTHRRVKERSIRPHTNAVKPHLTSDNEKARLEFCLSMIEKGTLTSIPSFVNMENHIHIDEKWFYISKGSTKYYLHPNEKEPVRTCKSKRFVPKIMFLAAVARPQFDSTSCRGFDGKIGIWPFIVKEPAKRNSKNRSIGTIETKPISSITKSVIRSCLIEKLLPAIKEKWPACRSKTIFIQQDNAKPHIEVNDIEFVQAAREDGFDIRLRCQPANSPDMNVLDLGFFRAIDSLQHQEAPNTIDEFILAVEKAFDTFPSEDINKVFLTLQLCMLEVMKVFGGNDYKIPHISKQKLMRNGQLPNSIECDSEVLNSAMVALNERWNTGS